MRLSTFRLLLILFSLLTHLQGLVRRGSRDLWTRHASRSEKPTRSRPQPDPATAHDLLTSHTFVAAVKTPVLHI